MLKKWIRLTHNSAKDMHTSGLPNYLPLQHVSVIGARSFLLILGCMTMVSNSQQKILKFTKTIRNLLKL